MKFNRAIVFYNPAGTRAATVKRRITELTNLLGEDNVEIIETHDGREANTKLLQKHAYKLTDNSILCIAAGDGTTNQIIEALLMAPGIPSHARNVAVLPLWGGNANDLAHMLNGNPSRNSLKNIIQNGNTVPIHPLQCELVDKNKKIDTHLAACYVTFGATAVVARKLNKPAHRKSRLHAIPGGRVLQDAITVVSGLVEAPAFSVKESDKVRVLYEVSIFNGSRMAKITRLPAKLTEEMFFLDTFDNKKLVSVVPRLFNFARKKVSQKFLRSYASFTTQEESWAQFDGEAVKVPAQTHVQIQLHQRPFYALSTTLTRHK